MADKKFYKLFVSQNQELKLKIIQSLLAGQSKFMILIYFLWDSSGRRIVDHPKQTHQKLLMLTEYVLYDMRRIFTRTFSLILTRQLLPDLFVNQ